MVGSRWRNGETYIFVLDPGGNMLVHPDPALQGKSQLELKDVNGKPIIRGLLGAATKFPSKTEGWYHYQWPVPGEILPRWKSSYVRLVTTPAGERYVVGSGMYTERMEPSFVVDAVTEAVAQIERAGKEAFPLLHDQTGPFIAKDAYVFVVDSKGNELVNPAFPNLEGRNLLDLKDTQGKLLIREMFDVVKTRGSGWVDYMWPKPGESVATRKSTYVTRAKLGDEWALVGSGVYLADAAKQAPAAPRLTAPQLMTLVREGATVVEERGEQAYPEFRTKGSKWFRDNTYFFLWTMDGIRVFHAADPAGEGTDVSDMKDILGRPIGQQFLEVAHSPSGEGWVHYMYPEPGDIFPTWKSTFNRAATLIADQGKEAFPQLRDKTGAFVFLDTYVFVDAPDGTELVNAAQPSFEGKNIIDLKDLTGKALARDYIAAAMKDGSAWVEYYWFKPGQNIPARKQAFVRKVQHGQDTFIVGSGLYVNDESVE
jgi:signal transduction histidine kinase